MNRDRVEQTDPSSSVMFYITKDRKEKKKNGRTLEGERESEKRQRKKRGNLVSKEMLLECMCDRQHNTGRDRQETYFLFPTIVLLLLAFD